MEVAPEVHADPARVGRRVRAVTTVTAISDVRTPILIVHGTADTVVPVGHASVVAEAAPTAELRIIEGAEHQLRKEPARDRCGARVDGAHARVSRSSFASSSASGSSARFSSASASASIRARCVILGFIVLFGALAIAVADKARSGAVQPASCPECGGLISPNAPHCKHCGEVF